MKICKKSYKFFLAPLITALAICFISCGLIAEADEPTGDLSALAEKVSVVQIPFIANEGQIKDDQVLFYAKNFEGTVSITNNEIIYSLAFVEKPKEDITGLYDDKPLEMQVAKGWTFKEKFVKALDTTAQGVEMLETNVNYFIGNDPSEWQQNIAAYNQISLGQVYPGIKLNLRTQGNNVEKVFTIEPGSEASQIKIKVEGAESLKENELGQLELATGLGVIRFTAPVAYQEKKSGKEYVQVRYHLDGDTYGFWVGDYDKSLPLIIDPMLASTLIGASRFDWATSIELDSTGNIYIAGYTESTNFPTTPGSFNPSYNGDRDVFIAKFDNSLSTLLSSTFLGGSYRDYPNSNCLAIDQAGDVFLSGITGSNDFPNKNSSAAGSNIFIVKLDSQLNTILASAFCEGDSYNTPIVLSQDGDVYLTGGNNYHDAYISKYDNDLTTLIATTTLSGNANDYAVSTSIDEAGNIIVTGCTYSVDFPVTPGAYGQPSGTGSPDVFIAKFDSSLENNLASTCIGGTDYDYVSSLSIDDSGNIFVAGSTYSTDYPVTLHAFSKSLFSSPTAFISKFDNTLSNLLSSTLAGSIGFNTPPSLAINDSEEVYLSGSYLLEESGISHAIIKLDNSLSRVLATSPINYYVYGIIVDSAGDVYVTGFATLGNSATEGAFDTSFNGFIDAFVSKLSGDLISGDKATLGRCPYCFYANHSINLSTGNFILEQTDLKTPTLGPPLEFTRFYNSTETSEGILGRGWTHNYNTRLTFNNDGSISVTYADGHIYTFTYNGVSYDRPAGCFENLSAGPDRGYTLTFRDQINYIFDSAGNLLNIVDKNNNQVELTYIDGLMTTAAGAFGRTLSFTYDANRHLASVTDQAGRVVTYSCDSYGYLNSVQSAQGDIIRYSYDSFALNKVIGSDNSILLQNTYDMYRRVIRQTDGNGAITQFSYDPYNHRTSITSPLGNYVVVKYDEKYRGTEINHPGNTTETFAYDSNCCLISVTDAAFHTTRYTYDDNGNILTVTDPAGNQTNMTYDARNNLLSLENAAGKTIALSYDANSNLTLITDPLGNSTTYTYDGSGCLLSKTTPDPDPGTTTLTYQNGLLCTMTGPTGNTVTYDYDTCGRMINLSDTFGRISTYDYDAADNLVSRSDALGNTTSFTYDWRHNKLTETDPKGNITRYSYDGAGNLTSVVNALNYITQLAYDLEGRLVKITDARGSDISYIYDALGRLTGITNPLGYTTFMQYDPVGNLTEKIDTLGKQTLTVNYDELNRPITLTDALGHSVQHDYDNLSRITSFTDPASNITKFCYDDLNRLTSTTDPLLGEGSQAFDPHGNRVTLVDPNNNMTRFSYDNADRLIEKYNMNGGCTYVYNARDQLMQKINARGQVANYEYDNAGNLICLSSSVETVLYTYDQNGNLLTAADNSGATTCEYDALNQLVKYTDSQGDTILYAYDPAGNLVTLTYTGELQVSYEYNASNQLTSVTDWAGRITNYEYDSNGRLIKTLCPNGTIMSRTYDDAGRLLQQKDTGSDGNVINLYEYSYDLTGNIICDNDSNDKADTELLSTYSEDLTYTQDNRLSSYKGQAVLYDADGNMITGPMSGNMVIFTYDSRNRLTAAGNTNYTYDAANNRISVADAVYQKNFVVNPNPPLSQVLIETDERNSKTYYVYGLGLIGQESEGGDYRTYHYDYRGSTVALTDNNGLVTDRFQYAPYGELTSRSGDTSTPFLFNGRYGVMTDASDLYYMRARYYNPVVERFLSADIILGRVTYTQSLNRYAFCENNPVNNLDPSGQTYTWALNLISKGYNQGFYGAEDASLMVFGANSLTFVAPDLTDTPDKGEPMFKELFIPFHEIAQINIAKALYKESGQHPEIEKRLEAKDEKFLGLVKKYYEADIVLGSQVWEVKPIVGEDPKNQLEKYKIAGNLTEGKKLQTIENIPIFDNVKMEVTFPELGVARYQLYEVGSDNVRKDLTTVGAAYIVAKLLAKSFPAGRRLGPAW